MQPYNAWNRSAYQKSSKPAVAFARDKQYYTRFSVSSSIAELALAPPMFTINMCLTLYLCGRKRICNCDIFKKYLYMPWRCPTKILYLELSASLADCKTKAVVVYRSGIPHLDPGELQKTYRVPKLTSANRVLSFHLCSQYIAVSSNRCPKFRSADKNVCTYYATLVSVFVVMLPSLINSEILASLPFRSYEYRYDSVFYIRHYTCVLRRCSNRRCFGLSTTRLWLEWLQFGLVTFCLTDSGHF